MINKNAWWLKSTKGNNHGGKKWQNYVSVLKLFVMQF